MSLVHDRTAIVTGGAAGVGRNFAKALAEAGAHVTICDVSADVADVAEAFRADGLDVTGIQADVSVPDDVQRVVTQAAAATGTVDVLINNAGVVALTDPADAWDKSLADYDHVMGANFKGAYLFGRAVIPLMLDKQRGDIINISTDHVHTCGWPEPVAHEDSPLCPWKNVERQPGWVGLDLYDSSKWALHGLTQAWAKTLRSSNIRVNNVCMGATDSAMQRGFFGYGYEPGTEPPEHLMSWWNNPDAVAQVVLELVDEGPQGRSGDNVGLWLGHPTVLPPASPKLNVPVDFTPADLADLSAPPTN